MVGNTDAAGTRPAYYTDLADVMRRRPSSAAVYSDPRKFEADRLAWLFELADALDAAGLAEDGESVRDAALRIVHGAVDSITAGGEGR
ncbi:hypothetical protein BAY59_29195 [Prauserella coralliicola]|nr:hypothetical protein BAY59_29195 [Prauserella coralliicola]